MFKVFLKIRFLAILLCVMHAFTFSQDKVNTNATLYVLAGLSSFPDITRNENSYLVGLGFRRKLTESFSAELFLQRSAANSTLPFFNDKEALADYLIGNQIAIPTDWAEVTTNAFGAKIHLAFLDKGRHFFSVGLGYGFYFSKSRIQRFKEFSVDSEGSLTDFEVFEESGERNKSFVTPGFRYTLDLYKGFGLGLDVSGFFELNSEAVVTIPVLPNFYSVSFLITKSF